MISLLTRFFFETGKMFLPGIGSFDMKGNGADANLAADLIQAPSWKIGFKAMPETSMVDENLISWISLSEKMSKESSAERLQNFVMELKQKLEAGEKIEWEGLGTISKDSGEILFTQGKENYSPFSSVVAKKVIRENTSYTSLVGDKETTTGEMRAYLEAQKNPQKNHNTILWVVLLCGLMAATWFIVKYGLNASAFGNKQNIMVEKPTDTYQLK